MWSWISSLADRLVASFDNGSFFRKPWKAVYTIASVLVGALGIIACIVTFGGGAMGLYKLYDAQQYALGVQSMQVAILLALALVFLGLFLARIWWVRRADLETHTEGHKVFISGPIAAHVVRTLGEVVGVASGLWGVLAFLALWPAPDLVSRIPFVGEWLRNLVGPALYVALLAPVTAFLSIMFSRWLAEVIEVFFAIANNTRALRYGSEPRPPIEQPKAEPPPLHIDWSGIILGGLCYLLIALPLSENLGLVPALTLLILSSVRNRTASLSVLVAIALILLVRGVFMLAYQWDPGSVAEVFLEKSLPLLVILLLLVITAVVLVLAEYAERFTSTLTRRNAWMIGIGIAVLYNIHPAARTISEAMKRHELTAGEMQQAKDLFKDYETRRYGWRRMDRVDTTRTFTVEPPRIEVDKYGLLTIGHHLNFGDGAMEGQFTCLYTNIKLPDSIAYNAGYTAVKVRYLNGDSIKFHFDADNAHWTAVAVDRVRQMQEQQASQRLEAFEAYRDSLNQRVDTLSGTFLSYDCADGTCFAWFDVLGADGVTRRSLYCAASTISGYPINALPKDDATWTIVIRETAQNTPEAISSGSGPVVYELFALRPVVKAPVPPVEEVPIPPVKPAKPDPAEARQQPKQKVYNESEVEDRPMYPGGQSALAAYLATRIYPPDLKASGIPGKVKVSFVVTSEGVVNSVQISRSPGYVDFDTEAKRLVSGMKRWTPGMKDGRPVDVRTVVTVDFSLNE